MRVLHLVAVTAVFGLAKARSDSNKRGDFEALGIERGDEVLSNEFLFTDSQPAVFLEAFHGAEKNESVSQLQDRSAELFERQQCQAGYGYCSGMHIRKFCPNRSSMLTIVTDFGRCCPSSNRCCSYGYCLEPGKTCCPNGPCGAGLTCCENKCIPIGSQCCRGGDYCE